LTISNAAVGGPFGGPSQGRRGRRVSGHPVKAELAAQGGHLARRDRLAGRRSQSLVVGVRGQHHHHVRHLRGARLPRRHHRATLAAAIAELDARMEQLLARRPTHPANRPLVKHGQSRRGGHHWRAQQAVPPAVVNRKVCGGNRSWSAAGTQQVLMTLFRTAYHQGVEAIALFTGLLRSSRHHRPPRHAPSPVDRRR
jgi:hypothetical protein